MNDETLRALATKAGIASQWTDQTGAERHVSPDTLRAILSALGLPADSEASLRNSLSILEGGFSTAAISRFITARVGQPVSLPVGGLDARSIEIEFEGGARRDVTAQEGVDGILALPPLTEPGYHRVMTPSGVFTVATAPERCITVADLIDARGAWGLAAQIYSLRSSGDGGIGNFAGVAALGRAAARRGADALAIGPVHALFGVEPSHFSPYSPSTRLFYNPLHAEPVLALPEELVRDAIAQAGVGEEMARLEKLTDVDWLAATPPRQKLLRQLYTTIRERDAENPPWRADFESFLAEASSLLKAHATFETLQAFHLKRDRGAWNWSGWPAEHRDPESLAVADFATEHRNEIDFQIFVQWLTARSYAEAQRNCREAGMAIGLVADLAIGMDGSGSHAWSRQHEVLHGLSIGAPPDYYSTEGQNWGLTTFSPYGLATSSFAPFIDTLRASLRYVGGVRIDHVMGMNRLWLIPHGATAVDGAYVSFQSETMFRLIALESWRHRAVVIGEDLGTLPDGFRNYLREQGIAGVRVLRFERNEHGHVQPENWDPSAVALTTTHDLIPTAGWWSGADLKPAEGDPELENIRAWDRGMLWAAFQQAEVVDGDRPPTWDTAPVVDAAIRYIAKTPCQLKLLAVEDALAIQRQPNVPGTTTEKPNWRHRLDGDAATLLDQEPVRRRLSYLGSPREPGS
jgi:4-alpha-glucanotransferase